MRTLTAMAALGIAALLGACAPGGDAGSLVIDGARVSLPDGWRGLRADPAEWPDGRTLALLSNAPLDPACREVGSARSCTAPATMLGEGQVLVWWLSTNCAGPTCSLPSGARRLVGGREAAQLDGVHACDALEPSGQRAYLVSVSPQRVDALVICENGSSTATDAALEALLEGIDWRTP